jgi:hypothetical protein
MIIIAILLLPTLLFAQDSSVSRHGFTSKIVDREPIDVLVNFTITDKAKIYYFTELTNMQGIEVSHVWYQNHRMVYQMPVTAGGSRWRTYSSMNAANFTPGDTLTVEVIGADGLVHAKDRIRVE